MQKLAADTSHVGGKIGMTGVLHTWRRDLLYHPHVHFIVPGVGFDVEKNRFHLSHRKFFVPVEALSIIFRAKFRDELKKSDKALFQTIPSKVWKKDWVVYSKPVGNGEHALEYLAPYVYRVAISNNRIMKLENDMVTFRYRESKTGRWKIATIPAFEFIRRFCTHVLPRRFVKVRHYGFLGPARRKILGNLRYLINAFLILMHMKKEKGSKEKPPEKVEDPMPFRCRKCGGVLRPVLPIEATVRGPPNAKSC